MAVELREGTQIGSYTLIRRIGAGGMAEVYLAQQKGPGGFERTVALKFLYTERSDESHVRSLVDEARIAVRLDHPGIVRIFDLGSHEGLIYLVMEYVNGKTLSELWKRQRALSRPPSSSVLYAIADQLLEALHYAHTADDEHDRPLHVVHRDIKPGNLMLRRTGRLKILDFGIARASLRAQGTMTQGKGTLTYMAPEQLGEGAIGPEADVYSVGVVLFELATSRPLFSGDSLGTLISNRQRGISLQQLESLQEAAPAWAPVITRALATSPMERWASAEAMRTALPTPRGGRNEVSGWYASLVPDNTVESPEQQAPSSPTAEAALKDAAFPRTIETPAWPHELRNVNGPPPLPGKTSAIPKPPASPPPLPPQASSPTPTAPAPLWVPPALPDPENIPDLNSMALQTGHASTSTKPARGLVAGAIMAIGAVLIGLFLLLGSGERDEQPAKAETETENEELQTEAVAEAAGATAEEAAGDADASSTAGTDEPPVADSLPSQASEVPPEPSANTPSRNPRLEKQLTQAGRDDEAIGDIADAYMGMNGMTARACELYERALEIDPDDSEWVGKALSCSMEGLGPAELEALAERYARSDEALGDIGDRIAGLGDRERACRLYELALRQDSGDPEWSRKVRECRGSGGSSGKGGSGTSNTGGK